jgi:hypothetical protein
VSITVSLAKALICIAGECFPVLVGQNTPAGSFDLQLRYTMSEGYGGDVIQFHETDKMVFAIHRIWLLSPKQRRLERLASPTPEDNMITNGCINVAPEVYERLKENLDKEHKLEIVP